jgi:threonine/homoserine/homoserine lactone efflux protein
VFSFCYSVLVIGIHDLTIFVVSALLLNVSPGPDTVYIVARSTQFGWQAGVVAALGIAAGIVVHVSAAALGISALLAASATAFTSVKLIGAAYLIYLGVRMLIGERHGRQSEMTVGKPEVDLATIFRQGFITNVLNPKVALFFLAFLPQFIDAEAPSKLLAFVLLGLIFDLNGTLWNVLVAWIAARGAALMRDANPVRKWIERGVGALFIGIGIRLAVAARG